MNSDRAVLDLQNEMKKFPWIFEAVYHHIKTVLLSVCLLLLYVCFVTNEWMNGRTDGRV